MDFLVNMGDTWLSNTPRRGAVALRTTMQHSETQLCIACHPTQFTTRGYLKAIEKGYPPTQRARPRIPHRPNLQQRAPALRRAQHQLGARHLHSSYRVQPPATDRARVRAERDPRSAAQKVRRAICRVPEDSLQGRDGHCPATRLTGANPTSARSKSPPRAGTPSTSLTTRPTIRSGSPSAITSRNWPCPAERRKMSSTSSWKIMFFSEVNREKYTPQIDKLIDKLYEYETSGRKLAVPIRQDRPSPPTSSPTMRFWRWQKPAVAPRPTSTWRAPSKPCLQRSGPKAVGKEILCTRDSTRRSAPRNSRSWRFPPSIPVPQKPRTGTRPIRRHPARWRPMICPLLLQQLDQFWDLASEPQLTQIRNVLAAAISRWRVKPRPRALGHMADPGAVPVLSKRSAIPARWCRLRRPMRCA